MSLCRLAQMFADHFSGPDGAVSLVRVSTVQTIFFEKNDL